MGWAERGVLAALVVAGCAPPVIEDSFSLTGTERAYANFLLDEGIETLELRAEYYSSLIADEQAMAEHVARAQQAGQWIGQLYAAHRVLAPTDGLPLDYVVDAALCMTGDRGTCSSTPAGGVPGANFGNTVSQLACVGFATASHGIDDDAEAWNEYWSDTDPDLPRSLMVAGLGRDLFEVRRALRVVWLEWQAYNNALFYGSGSLAFCESEDFLDCRSQMSSGIPSLMALCSTPTGSVNPSEMFASAAAEEAFWRRLSCLGRAENSDADCDVRDRELIDIESARDAARLLVGDAAVPGILDGMTPKITVLRDDMADTMEALQADYLELYLPAHGSEDCNQLLGALKQGLVELLPWNRGLVIDDLSPGTLENGVRRMRDLLDCTLGDLYSARADVSAGKSFDDLSAVHALATDPGVVAGAIRRMTSHPDYDDSDVLAAFGIDPSCAERDSCEQEVVGSDGAGPASALSASLDLLRRREQQAETIQTIINYGSLALVAVPLVRGLGLLVRGFSFAVARSILASVGKALLARQILIDGYDAIYLLGRLEAERLPALYNRDAEGLEAYYESRMTAMKRIATAVGSSMVLAVGLASTRSLRGWIEGGARRLALIQQGPAGQYLARFIPEAQWLSQGKLLVVRQLWNVADRMLRMDQYHLRKLLRVTVTQLESGSALEWMGHPLQLSWLGTGAGEIREIAASLSRAESAGVAVTVAFSDASRDSEAFVLGPAEGLIVLSNDLSSAEDAFVAYLEGVEQLLTGLGYPIGE